MNFLAQKEIMNQGLIMEVLASWKKVQRIVESGVAAGMALCYKQ
jgi:hypothetical protein